MRKRLSICEATFRRLWLAGEMSRVDLANHFRCSVSAIDNLRAAMKLPKKKRTQHRPEYIMADPTPDEIAQRAQECRERHYAQRRSEPVPTMRVWRRQQQQGAA